MKVISRIKGGLGNQLFCYSAARRLALLNGIDLVIDDISGFVRDHEFHRKYALDHFNIKGRKAKPAERLEPFERYRRGVLKWRSRGKSFDEKRYVEQEGLSFDERLLSLKMKNSIYLDGYWQSERYFKDIESIIREDLLIIPPTDEINLTLADVMQRCKPAVALHVRWFESQDKTGGANVSASYYKTAIDMMENYFDSPRYFLFSDDLEAAKAKLELPENRVTLVSHNHGDENAFADLWLMTHCHHMIMANSTFSWWGAWLNSNAEKIIIAPKNGFANQTDVSDFYPNSWLMI